MPTRKPILVATDLSEGSDGALCQGYAIATQVGAPLIACHILPEAYQVRVLFPQEAGRVVPFQQKLEQHAASLLQKQLHAVLGPMTAQVEIESGSAHGGTLVVAARLGAGLIVLGAGATAARVARSATCPVLIARPSPAGGSILGATDFSDPSLPAVQTAAAEAKRRGASLRLLHCMDIKETAYPITVGLPAMFGMAPFPESLAQQLELAARDRLAAALATTGMNGELLLDYRQPAHGIVECAKEAATALIVVGTRGRTGLALHLLGSVAENVIGSAPCSVMTVPLTTDS